MDMRNAIINFLKEQGYCYLARDGLGAVAAYVEKPFKNFDFDCWDISEYSLEKDSYFVLGAFATLFPDIKWEDKKPFEIK